VIKLTQLIPAAPAAQQTPTAANGRDAARLVRAGAWGGLPQQAGRCKRLPMLAGYKLSYSDAIFYNKGADYMKWTFEITLICGRAYSFAINSYSLARNFPD